MSTPFDTKKTKEKMDDCENISLINCKGAARRSRNSITILVVDDDTTCLSIVAALLKKLKYQVVTAKHPNDALCALRIKGGAFDLVVSDVHMPDMNGFQLQEVITHEFNLPVVLMSVDSKEVVFSKGALESSGEALFISKPVSPNDLKDLWQFTNKTTSEQVVIIEEEEEEEEEKEECRNYNSSNRKAISKEGNKKAKVKWTDALHCRFLEAIRSIGLERAVPKKILQVMNVPGLTRENVASHLQKYRIFLKRVSDASYKLENVGHVDSRRSSSSCISNYSSSSYSPSRISHQTLNNTSRSIQDFPNRFWYQESPSPSMDHHHPGLMINYIRAAGHGIDQYRSSSQVGTTTIMNSNDFMHQYTNYGGFINFGGANHLHHHQYYQLQNNINDHYLGVDSHSCTNGQGFIDGGVSDYHGQDNLSFIEKEQGLLTHHQQQQQQPAFDIQNQYGCLLSNISSYHQPAVYQQELQGATQYIQFASPQFNEPLLSLNQRDDVDDVNLESLLAFGEDPIQILEGI